MTYHILDKSDHYRTNDMIPQAFLKFSGAALCLSGAVYILDTALDALAPGANPGVGVLVPVFGLIGFSGFWLTLRKSGVEGLALAAYALSMAGLAGLGVVTFIVNRLLPDLEPRLAPEILAAILPEFMAIGVAFLLSALLLAPLCWRTGGRVRAGGALYALGAIPVSLPPLMPAALIEAGGLSVGAALLIWGAGLLASRAEP